MHRRSRAKAGNMPSVGWQFILMAENPATRETSARSSHDQTNEKTSMQNMTKGALAINTLTDYLPFAYR